jgi:hypothetical protein
MAANGLAVVFNNGQQLLCSPLDPVIDNNIMVFMAACHFLSGCAQSFFNNLLIIAAPFFQALSQIVQRRGHDKNGNTSGKSFNDLARAPDINV